jgi:4-hydroxyphenylpyruvate dioxygenase
MGPFPHDAPPAAITPHNPMGTDGFAFVEFAHPEPQQLHRLFRLMGFSEVARHRNKAITVYRQGDVDYLVNEEPRTQAARFAALHGPCAASMGFRVVDATQAYKRALSLGAEPADPEQGSPAIDVPAIKGIGGSLSTWSIGTARKAQFTTTLSVGSAGAMLNQSGGASIISIT